VCRSEVALVWMSRTAPPGFCEVTPATGGRVREPVWDGVERFGLPRATLADIRGDDPAYNAQVVREVLAGDKGPIRDTVLLNAAAGLVAHARLEGTVSGTFEDRMAAGLEHARRSIDDGLAARTLQRWVEASTREP